MTTKKDGQIIVTEDELLPMSEPPELTDELVAYGLIYFDYTSLPSLAVLMPHGWSVSVSGAIGWIPVPIYIPTK